MAQSKRGKGAKPMPMLPHIRSLNKSSSAPLAQTQETWLSKLGKLFKSLSTLDTTSRDRAAAAEEHSTAVSSAVQHFGVGASERQRTATLSSRKQMNRTHQQLTPLSIRPEVSTLTPQPSLPQPSRQLSKLESLKRMVSGMFRQQPSSELIDRNQQQPTTAMAPLPHYEPARPTPNRPSPSPTTRASPTTALAPIAQASQPPPIFSPSIPVDRPSVVRDSASSSLRTSRPTPASVSAVHFTEPPPSRKSHLHDNILAMSDDLPLGMDRPVWRIEDYSDLQQIHAGYASYVFKAHCRLSNQTVALKIYNPTRLHEISQFQLLREARLHTHLKHPNIVRLYAAFQQDDGVVLVQEYADGGDLLQLLYECGSRLSERRTVRLVIEPLLKALHFLHAQAIIHRDIKLENILFTGEDLTLKLADFGLCLNMREERSVTRAGTLDYMAPEVLKCPTKNTPADNKERLDLAYNCSVDIWAVGVVAYELLNGVPPFTRKDRDETERLIMQGAAPEFQVHASEVAKDFIYSCLTRNSRSRPSAQQLLRFPWLKVAARPASGQAHDSSGSRQRHQALGAGHAPPAIKGQSHTPALAANAGSPAGSSSHQHAELLVDQEALESEGDDGSGRFGSRSKDERSQASATLLPNSVPEKEEEVASQKSSATAEATHSQRTHSPVDARKAEARAADPVPPATPSAGGKHGAAPTSQEAEETAAQQAMFELQNSLASYDPRSSASEMRELQYSALKYRNNNEDKHMWKATVEYIDQMADTRRAGRQLQHQQAVVYRAGAAPEGRQPSLRWKEEDMQQALEGAASSPKRRLERAASDLSRHTTDAGYLSAARSRKGSESGTSDDGDVEHF